MSCAGIRESARSSRNLMRYVPNAHLRQRWKEMNEMAAVAEEKRMDVVLPQSEKALAAEVMEFLEEMDQREQREFMNFLQGAKFVMSLNRTPGNAV